MLRVGCRALCAAKVRPSRNVRVSGWYFSAEDDSTLRAAAEGWTRQHGVGGGAEGPLSNVWLTAAQARSFNVALRAGAEAASVTLTSSETSEKPGWRIKYFNAALTSDPASLEAHCFSNLKEPKVPRDFAPPTDTASAQAAGPFGASGEKLSPGSKALVAVRARSGFTSPYWVTQDDAFFRFGTAPLVKSVPVVVRNGAQSASLYNGDQLLDPGRLNPATCHPLSHHDSAVLRLRVRFARSFKAVDSTNTAVAAAEVHTLLKEGALPVVLPAGCFPDLAEEQRHFYSSEQLMPAAIADIAQQRAALAAGDAARPLGLQSQVLALPDDVLAEMAARAHKSRYWMTKGQLSALMVPSGGVRLLADATPIRVRSGRDEREYYNAEQTSDPQWFCEQHCRFYFPLSVSPELLCGDSEQKEMMRAAMQHGLHSPYWVHESYLNGLVQAVGSAAVPPPGSTAWIPGWYNAEQLTGPAAVEEYAKSRQRDAFASRWDCASP